MNQDPKSRKIFGLTTHKSLEETLYTNRIQKFLSGSIFGTDAALISIFRKSTVPALILYAECHPFFPDPEASINATSSLAKILNIKINTDDIKKRIERLRIQHRNLMEQTIKKLQQQRVDSQGMSAKPPQIYK